MKYPDIKLGQVEAVWNKLGGEEGVQRFLAGKSRLEPKPTLELVKDGVCRVPPVHISFHRKEDGSISICHRGQLGDSFDYGFSVSIKNLDLPMYPGIIRAPDGEQHFSVSQLNVDLDLEELRKELKQNQLYVPYKKCLWRILSALIWHEVGTVPERFRYQYYLLPLRLEKKVLIRVTRLHGSLSWRLEQWTDQMVTKDIGIIRMC